MTRQRRIGEMLKASERAKGTRGQLKGKDSSGGTHREPPEDNGQTLSELGISKKESSKAQQLAELPEETICRRIILPFPNPTPRNGRKQRLALFWG
jgi:hypothetical protein